MKYTRDDLQALPDAVELIRQRPKMFLPRVSGEVLVQRLVEEANILCSGKVASERVDNWWVVVAEKDWFRACPELSVDELFTRIVAFPEAGPNSMHAEVLLTAFASVIVTLEGGQPRIIKGNILTTGVAWLLSGLEGEWARVVAFRLEEEEAS